MLQTRWAPAGTSGIHQAACFIDRGLAISITLSPWANQAAGWQRHPKCGRLFREDIVRATLGSQFEVKRADDYPNAGSITRQVIVAIKNADLIVADLTGRNPNVYYELGGSFLSEPCCADDQ